VALRAAPPAVDENAKTNGKRERKSENVRPPTKSTISEITTETVPRAGGYQAQRNEGRKDNDAEQQTEWKGNNTDENRASGGLGRNLWLL